jgi:hypothetical protein
MKDRISLNAMNQRAFQDAFELSGLNFWIYFISGVILISLLLVHEFCYGPISFNVMVVVIIGFILSETLKSKALLDIVHNRKQNLSVHPLTLIQAFLIQILILGFWYSLFLWHYFGGVLDAFLATILILFSCILVRLQFASLYILEYRYSILQAMHHSWLLTMHNNWLFEKFICWQFAVACIGIFIFKPHLEWNVNFLIITLVLILNYVTNMQVRMFKELSKLQDIKIMSDSRPRE